MDFPKIKNLKVHQISNDAQIIVGNGVKVLKINDEYVPFLSETETLEKFPYVMVDMGAVKFMCKGGHRVTWSLVPGRHNRRCRCRS